MKFYMSWWTKGNKHYSSYAKMEEILFYTEKNINLLRKNYDEINLITDNDGKNIFKNLKWSNIYTPLENISDKHSQVWCLGKLYAYQFLTQKNEPFMHVDYDFFIFNKLPNNVLSCGILTQSEESLSKLFYVYNLDLFEKKCINKYLAKNIQTSVAYNCGIVGGHDINFFDFYSDTAIKMIEDDKNVDLWLNKNNAKDYYTLPILAEQYYLAASAKFLNRKVNCLFDLLANDLLDENKMYSPRNMDFFERTGCIHPFGHHNKNYLKDKLNTLLSNI